MSSSLSHGLIMTPCAPQHSTGWNSSTSRSGWSSDKQPVPCTSKQSTSTAQANQDLFPSSDVGFLGLAPNSYTANVSFNVNNLNVTKHKSVV